MSTIQMTDVHFMAAHEAAVPLCKACKHASKRQTTLLPVFDVHQTAIRVPKSLMCNAHAGWSVLQHWRWWWWAMKQWQQHSLTNRVSQEGRDAVHEH